MLIKHIQVIILARVITGEDHMVVMAHLGKSAHALVNKTHPGYYPGASNYGRRSRGCHGTWYRDSVRPVAK